jgi:hypothetical protein
VIELGLILIIGIILVGLGINIAIASMLILRVGELCIASNVFLIAGAILIDWDIRRMIAAQKKQTSEPPQQPLQPVDNLTAKDKIIILTTIVFLYSSAIILVIYINSSTSDEEYLYPQSPFNFYAVDHEINNLSDMYIGFEFDNSTFTVNIDITNDSIYIRGIQPAPAPRIRLKVNNETERSTNTTSPVSMSCGSASYFPNFYYAKWKIVNLQYGENVTFFFSGKGRAIASDRSASDLW